MKCDKGLLLNSLVLPWSSVLSRNYLMERWNSLLKALSRHQLGDSTLWGWDSVLLLFGRPFVSDSLWPHGLQHATLPCPSLPPRVCSNSCPLSWWCHPIISSSVVPFSSCLQSFPASGSFLMSRFFESGGQSIGASASVLPMNMDCSQVLLLKPSADMRVMTSC